MPAALTDVLAEIALPAPTPEPDAFDAAPDPQRLVRPEPFLRRGPAQAEIRPETVEPAFGRQGPKPEEIEAMIAAARDEAVAQALEDARARFDTALDEARAEATAAHAAALAEARAAWVAEEGERLAGLLGEGLAAIEERLSEAAARALAPLLTRAAREKAIEETADAVSTLLRGETELRLGMRGAADLGEAVLARLGERAAFLDFVPADTPDLVVTGGDTIIETRFAAFAAALAADPA